MEIPTKTTTWSNTIADLRNGRRANRERAHRESDSASDVHDVISLNEEVCRQWADSVRTRSQFSVVREQVDPLAQQMLKRRQAWQFQMIPMRWQDGMLVIVTTAETCARATAFALSQWDEPMKFLIISREQMQEALKLHFPFKTRERQLEGGEELD